MNRTEAKRLAKAIDLEVDRRIREIREASDPAAIVDKIAERVRIKAANYGDGPFRADPRINAYRHIRREVEYAPLTDEGRAKATEFAWQKIDENLTKASVAKRLGQEIATLLDRFAPEQMERCRAGILSLIHYQKEGQAAAPTAAAVLAEPATASTAPGVMPFSPSTYTLSQAWDRWVRDGQGKHSPGTVKLAKGHWKAFLLSSKMAVIDPNGEVMPMEMLVQVATEPFRQMARQLGRWGRIPAQVPQPADSTRISDPPSWMARGRNAVARPVEAYGPGT